MVELFHTSDETLPAGTSLPIANYNVSGVAKAIEKFQDRNVTNLKPKITLSFALDASGIAKLIKAQATFEENVEVAVPRVKESDKPVETEEGSEGSSDSSTTDSEKTDVN
eukprot:UN27628